MVSGPSGPGFASGQALTLRVLPAFQIITTGTAIEGKVGDPYIGILTATGGTPPYSGWTVTSGSLPPGLTLDANSGKVSGSPTASGTFVSAVTVKDSTGLTSLEAKVTIIVVPALSVVTQSLPNAFTGVPYYVVVQGAGGFPPYKSWTIASGALPAGLALDPSSGVISGTPAPGAAGSYQFAITFSDGDTVSPPKTFTIALSNNPGTMTLAASANPATLGKPLTVTATADSASGSATFYDGTVVLGTASFHNGAAAFTTSLLGAGVHTLRARSASPPATASLAVVVLGGAGASFLPPVSYSIPNQVGLASPVIIADFNGDGKPDLAWLAATKSLNTYLAVSLGNGDGTFQPALLQVITAGSGSMAAADFNEDGATDIVISSGLGALIYLGNGDGTFKAGASFNSPPFGAYIATADFNGDGHTDLIYANSSNTAQIFLGTGDGAFRPAINVGLGAPPAALAVGDMNSDGVPDLAIADTAGNVHVALGNGDGSFQTPGASAAITPANALQIADLDGDGNADIVISGAAPNSLCVLAGRGDGTFRPAAVYRLGTGGPIAINDFNGDGIPDIAVSGVAPTSVMILYGNGDGSFRAGARFSSGSSGFAAFSPGTADFDGDGIADLALGLGSGGVSVVAGSLIAGANQLALAPASVVAHATPGVAPPPQTVTLTYQTAAPGAVTFSAPGATPASGPMSLTSPGSGPGSLYTYTANVSLDFSNQINFPGRINTQTAYYSAGGAYAALPITFDDQPPASVSGAVNAASEAQATPSVVSVGSYIAIYGTGLAGTASPSATSLPLPATLNGTQVTLGGIAMPLLYAGSGQINALVPQELAPNNAYSMQILDASGTLKALPVSLLVKELQPAIYTLDASGSGPGIVAGSATGKLISASNPAHAGDYLVVYCTGLGPVLGPNGEPRLADGAAAPTDQVFHTRAVVTASIGGVSAPVTFAGLTPTLAGLYQVNVQVPAGIASGTVPVVVSASDARTGATGQSNAVTIAVQ